MNANELADELNRLQKIYPLSIPFTLDEAATMLRQLQAEIEALKAEKEKLFMGMLDMALDAEIKDLKNGN